MNKIELAKGIYYVGVVDWSLRDFHGYYTPRGVTYNSYLIVDEKICLVDCVKAPYAAELLERIQSIIDPAKIDYVVVNHVEPDHSSALPIIMDKLPNAKVVLTAQGKLELVKHYQQNYDFQIVKENDILDLGINKLHFVPVPMLHWPDSMVTYLENEQILFSNDAFGQHICTSQRFDDQIIVTDALYEAEKYFANILMPYSQLIPKALAKLGQLQLKMIAPSHGVIWRKNISEILKKYEQWGQGYTDNKLVVLYDTMWGSTEKMARRILEGVAAAGMTAALYKMSAADRSEVVRDILECKGILVGSPTLNGTMLPTIGAMLIYLKGLRPKNKTGGTFGAYGWAGGAQQDMENLMQSAGITMENGPFIKWAPDDTELEKCFEFGFEFANKLINS